jgi:signal transduction histidine kinase
MVDEKNTHIYYTPHIMLKLLKIGLRKKILIFLFFYILSIITMSVISYNDLTTTEKKVETLELSNTIYNNVLESRRHEKNYFLYGSENSLYENITIIEKTLEVIDAISKNNKNLVLVNKLKILDNNITIYTKIVYELLDIKKTDVEKYNNITEKIRQQGKKITEIGEDIVNYERNQIHQSVRFLRKQLIYWSSVAISVSIILSLLIVFYIFKPLSVIKKAAEAIANGKFKKIEVINTRDEIQQVMETFNIMVSELERRQDQLIQSEKLSSLGTLTAGVAHQLNNPLNNISTSCQIAIDEFDSRDVLLQKRMLNNIYQETLRARDVVKNLLEFSRTQDFSLRNIQLADLVKKAVLLVRSQVPPSIQITVNIPDDLILPLDAQCIQEVFINLIINAAQAIERQGLINLTAAKDLLAREVVIEINDTGHGIPEKIQAKIFDPFFTTKEEGQGTGLGLSVAYGIIQQHQGNITVKSNPGQGTSFFIRLPLPSDHEN